MPTCVRCGKETGLLGAVTFNRKAGRCGTCEGEVGKALARFRQGFLDYTRDSFLSDQEWAWLQAGAASDQINLAEALEFIRGDALHFLDRFITFAAADGTVTEDEEQAVYRTQAQLAIPTDQARPLLDRLGYLRQITRVGSAHGYGG